MTRAINSVNVHMALMRGNVDEWVSAEKLVLSFTVTGDSISSNALGGTQKPHVPNAEILESKEDKHQMLPGWNQPTAFIAHSCLVLL